MNDKAVRLDKWLWAARFYKTRAIAQKSINNSQVLVNNQKSTSSRNLQVGNVITIKQGDYCRTYIVRDLSEVRRPYQEAKHLYEETQESIERNQEVSEKKALEKLAGHPRPAHRPDKKSRRKLREIRRKED